MRRKDREVTDQKKILEIIQSCSCCRLGFYDEGEIYIVPLNFGYEETNGKKIFYFHGAVEGRKIQLVQKKPHVSFELDTDHEVLPGDIACQYSMRYKSVMGSGKIEPIESIDEKYRALNIIMQHYTGNDNWNFSHSMLHSVFVFRLVVDTLSCKERV